jgi:hypothetical protein
MAQQSSRIPVLRAPWACVVGVRSELYADQAARVAWTRAKYKDAPTEEQAEKLKAAKELPPLTNYRPPGDVEMTQAEWKKEHADYTTFADATRKSPTAFWQSPMKRRLCRRSRLASF